MKVVKKVESDKIEKYMSAFNSGSEGAEIQKNWGNCGQIYFN